MEDKDSVREHVKNNQVLVVTSLYNRKTNINNNFSVRQKDTVVFIPNQTKNQHDLDICFFFIVTLTTITK